MEHFKVLLVEDDPLIADIAVESLTMAGFNVCGIATNIRQGVALATEHRPELAMVDIRLAGGDLGTTLAVKLKRIANIGILYATASVELLADAEGEAYLTKPYSLTALCGSLTALGFYVRTGKFGIPCPESMIMLRELPTG